MKLLLFYLAVAAAHVALRAGGPLPPLPAAPSPAPSPLGRLDTSRLVGGEYTPSGASNELWLAFYARYRAQVVREIAAAKRRLGVTVLRVFLHALLWESDAAGLLANLDDLLAIAAAQGVQLGFVLFDSCWGDEGASTTVECEATAGVHNGCWKQSPQASDRSGNVTRHFGYVTGVTRAFGSDPRVAWLEIYNEPAKDPYVHALRAAAHGWARALAPAAPVLSCWDYDTPGLSDASDVHAYSVAFASDWAPRAFANASRGALFTEAGCRAYQAPFAGDAGSPLAVLRFLETLRLRASAGLAPYVPGAMLAWEIAVGNSNTRWHWGSPPGAPEPAIPWCGMLFPDGTPVSYTEAAALRRYATGEDAFLFFEKFAGPVTTQLADGNPSLALPAGAAWWAAGAAVGAGALVEAAVWPALGGGVIELTLAAVNCTPAAAAACNTSVLPDTNACPGAAGETNFVVPPAEPDPAGACARACCAGAACAAWVLLPNASWDDKNCSCAAAPCACCWLKPPGCAGTAPRAGCTAGFLSAPPPPPPPPSLSGYVVALNYSTAAPRLTLTRAPAGGGARALLGEFDLRTLENGVVDGWSLLRVALGAGGEISVWLNPHFKETGFVGNSSDAARVPRPPPPRIAVVDARPLPPGGLAIAAASAPARVDYVSVLPLSEL
jgi:hypothetical protein